MNVFKYPDGRIVSLKNPQIKKETNMKKSRLGVQFENEINASNDYYVAHNIAFIYKKPTPIQVVKVDFPARNKARITEAYYKTPSTTDYNGIYKGKYVDFEAKSTNQMSFSFEKIYPHQIQHLNNVLSCGGIAFLLIEFSKLNEVYLLRAQDLITKYGESLKGERKSIPYEYFKQNGILIERKIKPQIDYLKAVDILIGELK